LTKDQKIVCAKSHKENFLRTDFDVFFLSGLFLFVKIISLP